MEEQTSSVDQIKELFNSNMAMLNEEVDSLKSMASLSVNVDDDIIQRLPADEILQ